MSQFTKHLPNHSIFAKYSNIIGRWEPLMKLFNWKKLEKKSTTWQEHFNLFSKEHCQFVKISTWINEANQEKNQPKNIWLKRNSICILKKPIPPFYWSWDIPVKSYGRSVRIEPSLSMSLTNIILSTLENTYLNNSAETTW